MLLPYSSCTKLPPASFTYIELRSQNNGVDQEDLVLFDIADKNTMIYWFSSNGTST